jgi:DNA-binding MarR family transcriptional regulator
MSSAAGTKPAEPAQRLPDDLLARFAQLQRELSTMTVLYHSRIAEQMGLSGTDHKCLDLAMQAKVPLTAGQIAQLSGLSTGAVTGVIDRLERRGLVRRLRDPHDRRKVLVEVTDMDESRFAHLFQDLADLGERVLAQFTPAEWEVIERYARTLRDEFRKLVEARE